MSTSDHSFFRLTWPLTAICLSHNSGTPLHSIPSNMFNPDALQLHIPPRLLRWCPWLAHHRCCPQSWRMMPATLWPPHHPPLGPHIRSTTILSTWVHSPLKSTISLMQSVVSPLLHLHPPTLQRRLPCNRLPRLSMCWTLNWPRVMTLGLVFYLQCPPTKLLGFFTMMAHLFHLFGRVTPPMAPIPRRIGQRRSCIGS